MRRRIRQWLTEAAYRFLPSVNRAFHDQEAVAFARQQVSEYRTRARTFYDDGMERLAELSEAVHMAGAGPWKTSDAAVKQSREVIRSGLAELKELRESILTQGATSDIELALQNVEWRREVNLSWLEFSRWGIQQIILISRLNYIKNPLIRRLIDVSAYYVFGRGVEISSPDETANDVLKDFFERNKSVIGQIALVDLEKRKYYDGNIFFAFFSDKTKTGETTLRTIDATEIEEILTDPEDSDTPWFYKRSWTQRIFDEKTGAIGSAKVSRYYPALGYEPEAKIKVINQIPVEWDTPILHRKCGGVAKWQFGCPIIYPALDWAKAARKYLESCLTLAKSHAQYAWDITTKGGQQAIEGIKGQLQTTVGPTSPLWDQNPTGPDAKLFVSGPGTTIKPTMTRGASANPEEVRQYKLMCCIVVGVPETFLADVSTGNLATATTLDRPTELCFMEKQEAWREDLMTIAKYVLKVSLGATSGTLREAKRTVKGCVIKESRRVRSADGRSWREVKEEPKDSEIIVSVNFPAIREGDLPQLITAAVDAMTLGNRGGQVVGIDEKVGVRHLYDLIGIENGDEVTEEQYPDGEYDPDRTKQELTAPIPKLQPLPAGTPKTPDVRETVARATARLLVNEVMKENGVTGQAIERSHPLKENGVTR